MKQILLLGGSILSYLVALFMVILYLLAIIYPRMFLDINQVFFYTVLFTLFTYLGSILFAMYKKDNKQGKLFSP